MEMNMHDKSHRLDEPFDVIVVGGGNGGVSAAARLHRKGLTDVAIIEPQQTHTYRPLLSYVGGGLASLSSAQRSQRSVTPKGVTWLQDSVQSIDPDSSTVTCSSGRTYGYRDLVLATGLVRDEDELPGITEALDTPAVASNYLDRAEQTWARVKALPAGSSAVFTVPRPPVGCTGTTIKPLFLAADYWRSTGILKSLEVTLVIDRDALVGVPELDTRLEAALEDYGVNILYRTAVTALDPDNHKITVSGSGGSEWDLDYDFLHLVPPFRGPQWIEASGLTGESPHGLVHIDPHTFRHRDYEHIWSVGDGADVHTDPSGGGLRQQCTILVDNMIAAREGKALTTYDGYTVAPVPVDRRRLIAAEFDRDKVVQSSLPGFMDPLKPRRSAFLLDRYILPQVYWKLILKGRA